MVEGGMTPMQAIVASTRTASECIHLQNDVGTLEPGKLADLLIVDGDPLADLSALLRVRAVVHDGIVIRSPAR